VAGDDGDDEIALTFRRLDRALDRLEKLAAR
jgi:hypothetical protein